MRTGKYSFTKKALCTIHNTTDLSRRAEQWRGPGSEATTGRLTSIMAASQTTVVNVP